MTLRAAALLAAVLLVSPLPSASGQSPSLENPDTAGPSLRVVVNGIDVPLVARPIVYADVVMVPIQGVFEAFGAAVAWLPQDQSILISNRTKTVIRLRVGDPYAVIGTATRLLPITPVVLREVPFVPAQAVFGLLGAWTKLDEQEGVLYVNAVVNSVTPQRTNGTLRLAVNATGPVQADILRLTNPERTVIDLRNAVFRLPDQDMPVNDGVVTRVRISQFQVKPYITRIVLDVQQPVDVRVAESPTSFDLAIDVRQGARPGSNGSNGRGTSTSTPPPPQPTPRPADVSPSGQPLLPGESLKIQGVRIEQRSGVTRVVVEASATMQYVVRELTDPDRLVVDVMNAIFVPVKQEISVNSAAVDSVRAAQFQADPDITRVVVTLKRRVTYTVNADAGGSTVTIEIADSTLQGHAVVIDPGHGGTDPGAIGPTGLVEKAVVLDISLRVRKLLAEDGIRVIMTRESDVTVELADRARIARDRGGTVLVSIHANASGSALPQNGSETYYLSPQSLALAQMIQDEMGKILGIPSRGIKTANFLVLREVAMPAVLVEVAFLTHAQDEMKLRSEAYRQQIAASIARGINRFLAVYPVPAQF